MFSAEQFAAVGLTLLAVQMVICLPVYVRAVAELVRRHCTPGIAGGAVCCSFRR